MSKSKKKKSGPVSGLLPGIAAITVLVAVILIVVLTSGSDTPGPAVTQPATKPATRPVKIETPEDVSINLGYGLYITEVAKYTGVYMEDGSDDIVSGVMMIVVKNSGDSDIQLAEIEMPIGDALACFKLTTLPAGETAVLLETGRMAYTDAEYTTAIAKNVVLFDRPLSLYEDKLEIQILNGVINIRNISGQDIAGDIVIYYKNASADMLYGGITYRVAVSGGLGKNGIKQLSGSHLSASGSRIMFVTIG